MLSLFMLRARLLFSLGEMNSQKINEVTLAHEFSLALSNTAVVSLMDWVARRTPEGVCSQDHVTTVKAIVPPGVYEIEPRAF